MPEEERKEKDPKNYFLDLLYFVKKTSQLIKGYRKFFIFGLFLLLVTESLSLVSQYLFKDIVDYLPTFTQSGNAEYLIKLVVGIAICYIATSAFEYVTIVLISRTQNRLGHYLSVLVYGKLIDLSVAYHERENTGAKINKVENGIDRVHDMTDRLFWDFSPTLIRVIISAVVLFTIDWRIASVFLAVMPVYLYMTIRTNRKILPIIKDIRSGYERVYGKLTQAIFNVKTVQLFAQENEEKRRASIGLASIVKNQDAWVKIEFGSLWWRSNVSNLGRIFVISFGAYLALRQEITIGELVLFLTISFATFDSLFRMSRVFNHIIDAKVSIDRIYEILDSKEIVKSAQNALKRKLKGRIEFKDVSFAYKDKNVIDDIELSIEPGELVALVGPSGGGKSTIAKLLYRYYDVSHGKLLIDGVDIRNLNLKHYRRQLGMVSQDIDMFDVMVKDNIAYGQPKSSLYSVKRAAIAANADEFIEKLADKYDTEIGERGVKLSGGQRQRIGIARALLVNPKILILDEATSALDSESERKIQQAMKRLISGRTTIVIAHRLSTIKNADKIVVIDQGRIAEVGNHETLMKNEGVYKKLVDLQVKGYLQE
jgi:ABC-type multidrug transport system fused ATPase/permease subunit